MSESEPDIRIDRDRFVEEILASRRNQAQKISSSSKAEIAKPLFQLNRKRRHLNQDALSESDDEENDLEIVEVIKPSSEIDGELRVSSSSPKTNSKKSKAQSIESSDDEDFQREFKAAEAKAKCQIVESGFSVYSQEDYQRIREIR